MNIIRRTLIILCLVLLQCLNYGLTDQLMDISFGDGDVSVLQGEKMFAHIYVYITA